eukprot:COSAG02_NODE_8370_length_2596_cov_1.880256_4_plen_173_part_01
MLKALSRALKPTYESPFRDSPSPREMGEADPVVLSHKLDKKCRQLHRAKAHTKALASADYYLLVEEYLRAARSNRPKQSQKALWHRVIDYLKVSSTLSIVVLVRAAALSHKTGQCLDNSSSRCALGLLLPDTSRVRRMQACLRIPSGPFETRSLLSNAHPRAATRGRLPLVHL